MGKRDRESGKGIDEWAKNPLPLASYIPLYVSSSHLYMSLISEFVYVTRPNLPTMPRPKAQSPITAMKEVERTSQMKSTEPADRFAL